MTDEIKRRMTSSMFVKNLTDSIQDLIETGMDLPVKRKNHITLEVDWHGKRIEITVTDKGGFF